MAQATNLTRIPTPGTGALRAFSVFLGIMAVILTAMCAGTN